jgi:hypothetical protein
LPILKPRFEVAENLDHHWKERHANKEAGGGNCR